MGIPALACFLRDGHSNTLALATHEEKPHSLQATGVPWSPRPAVAAAHKVDL